MANYTKHRSAIERALNRPHGYGSLAREGSALASQMDEFAERDIREGRYTLLSEYPSLGELMSEDMATGAKDTSASRPLKKAVKPIERETA